MNNPVSENIDDYVEVMWEESDDVPRDAAEFTETQMRRVATGMRSAIAEFIQGKCRDTGNGKEVPSSLLHEAMRQFLNEK